MRSVEFEYRCTHRLALGQCPLGSLFSGTCSQSLLQRRVWYGGTERIPQPQTPTVPFTRATDAHDDPHRGDALARSSGCRRGQAGKAARTHGYLASSRWTTGDELAPPSPTSSGPAHTRTQCGCGNGRHVLPLSLCVTTLLRPHPTHPREVVLPFLLSEWQPSSPSRQQSCLPNSTPPRSSRCMCAPLAVRWRLRRRSRPRLVRSVSPPRRCGPALGGAVGACGVVCDSCMVSATPAPTARGLGTDGSGGGGRKVGSGALEAPQTLQTDRVGPSVATGAQKTCGGATARVVGRIRASPPKKRRSIRGTPVSAEARTKLCGWTARTRVHGRAAECQRG